MTKTLTEQWREGTLPKGGYYIKLLNGSIKRTDYDNMSKSFDTEFFRYNVSVKEVLAPVPSYEEYKELVSKTDELVQKMHILEKKLEIAAKALEETRENLLHVELSGLDGDNRQKMYDLMFTDGIIDKALKEMEGVK